jgi:hypothetical protein
MDVKKLLPFFGFFVVEPPDSWDGDAALFSNDFYCFRERHFFDKHHEIENVPSSVTSEAVKELFVPMNCKRRRLFRVERAKSFESDACLLETDVIRNYADEVGRIADGFGEIVHLKGCRGVQNEIV